MRGGAEVKGEGEGEHEEGDGECEHEGDVEVSVWVSMRVLWSGCVLVLARGRVRACVPMCGVFGRGAWYVHLVRGTVPGRAGSRICHSIRTQHSQHT